MATYGPVQLPAYLGDDATFRTWGQGIATALTQAGLVNNNDTGHIDWSSVSKPGTVSTAAGFEVYHLNDTMQTGGYPIFIKVEYGIGATATNRPALWITTGTITDGAGTLSGIVTTRKVFGPGASKAAGAQLPVYSSGDNSRLALCFSADPTTNTFPSYFVLERTRDADGAYTSDGWVVCFSSGGGAGFQVANFNAAIIASTVAANMCVIPVANHASSHNVGNIHASSTDIAIGTMVYFVPTPRYGLSLVSVDTSDAPAGGTFSVTNLGASHTYIAPGQSSGAQTYFGADASLLGILWE